MRYEPSASVTVVLTFSMRTGLAADPKGLLRTRNGTSLVTALALGEVCDELGIAFDGDAVLFSDEAERVSLARPSRLERAGSSMPRGSVTAAQTDPDPKNLTI